MPKSWPMNWPILSSVCTPIRTLVGQQVWVHIFDFLSSLLFVTSPQKVRTKKFNKFPLTFGTFSWHHQLYFLRPDSFVNNKAYWLPFWWFSSYLLIGITIYDTTLIWFSRSFISIEKPIKFFYKKGLLKLLD